MKRLTIILATLLLAGPALGDPANGWVECSSSTTTWSTKTAPARVGDSGRVCYELDETLTTSTGDTSFTCTGRTCKLQCNLDVQSSVTGDARFALYSCPNGFTPSADTCGELVQSFTADDSVALTTGTYWIDLTTRVGNGSAGEDMVCMLSGY